MKEKKRKAKPINDASFCYCSPGCLGRAPDSTRGVRACGPGPSSARQTAPRVTRASGRTLCPRASHGSSHPNPGEATGTMPLPSLPHPHWSRPAQLGAPWPEPRPEPRARSLPARPLRQLCSPSAPWTSLAGCFLVVGTVVHCRVFNSIPGLHPLDATSASLVVTNPSLGVAKCHWSEACAASSVGSVPV